MQKSHGAKTINDVARIAGVSKKTVSRVLNDSKLVSEKTRTHVRDTMQHHGFVPDRLARGLAARRSFLIGIVYDNPNALYIADAQQGVLDICREAGYELVVHPANYENPDLPQDVASFASRLKLDGIVLLSPISQNQDLIDRLTELDCPIARLCSIADETDTTRVVSADRRGAADIARYLIDLGHREIGFIAGPDDYWSAQERRTGFELALKQHGIRQRPQHVAVGNYDFQSGYECSVALLETEPRITAVFASNDTMAAGFYRAAHEKGVHVPADISVTGFDDSALASALSPSLTTVNQCVRTIGQVAAKRLLHAINDAQAGAAEESNIIEPTLIVRNSTTRLTVT